MPMSIWSFISAMIGGIVVKFADWLLEKSKIKY